MAEADLYNLHKVGRVYHCDFIIKGTRVHRSTYKASLAGAIVEARRWYDEALDKANDVSIPTLKETYLAWLKVKEHEFSDSHLYFMKLVVTVHAKDWIDTPINKIDNDAVGDIRAAYLAGTGESPTKNGGTITRKHSKGGANQVVKQIRALLGWAVETGRISACPFRIKKLKAQEKARAILWPEQVKDFVEEADRGGRDSQSKDPDRKPPQSAAALRMQVGLGLREGEVLQADWGWVDWRREVFVVGGQAAGREVSVKDRSLREIPIPSWVLSRLKSLWEAAKKPTTGLILPAPGGVQHDPQFTKKPVERCGWAMDITNLTPHRLRATFATGHFEAGTTLSQIQQMMGHSSPETTMKYIVQRPKDQAEAQKKLAVIMGFEKEKKTAGQKRHQDSTKIKTSKS